MQALQWTLLLLDQVSWQRTLMIQEKESNKKSASQSHEHYYKTTSGNEDDLQWANAIKGG